ncbi:hypothetical protein Zmor_021078 [Zophobas morio]|uniref:Tetraspanin n=1 Tax=Zophobas morio TaxID=2755281 RepID=A0AA38MAD6_9CUCU|nr:hypothetical protein Zmor_021078 [Zophobas morio]
MKLTLHHYRIITITVNILLMILGFVLMVFGISWMQEVVESRLLAASITANGSLTAFLGAFLIISAAFGLSTIIRKHIALVAVHGVVLFSGCITHVSIALYSFIDLSRIKTTSSKIYTRRILKAHQDAFIRNKTLQRNMLDNLHQILQCCGANSYADYSKRYNMELLPRSCCKNYEDPCKHPFTQGCTNAVIERTREILWVAGILSIVAAIVAVS